MYTWYAAVSYPATSGTFGTLAIACQICSITMGSLETHANDGTVSTLSDPSWARVLKALALAFSVVSWLVMLDTMLLQQGASRAFALAAGGWLSSAILLFVVIGVLFPRAKSITGTSPSNRGQTQFTQGFFYGFFAAGLCVLISALLLAYLCFAHRIHLTGASKSAMHDTTLMVRAMVFQLYLLIGAAIYNAIEGWGFPDSLYWADYTLLTVGIGNIVPRTHLGRSLLFPYASVGIIFLGMAVSALRAAVISQRHVKMNLRRSSAWRRSVSKHQASAGGRGHDTKRHQHRVMRADGRGSTTFLLPREEDFHDLQCLHAKYARRNRWHMFVSSSLTLMFLWLVAAVIFQRSEARSGWTYFDALYFTFTSLTTIGYGDFFPTSNFSTAFFVFWSLLAVPVLTFLISVVGDTLLKALWAYGRRVMYSRRLPFRRVLHFVHHHRIKHYHHQEEHEHHHDHIQHHQHGHDDLEHDDLERRATATPTSSLHRRKWLTTSPDTHTDTHTTAANDARHQRWELQLADLQHNPRLYLCLLSREIQEMTQTLKTDPNKQFSYTKWIEVFSLLNHRVDGTGGSRESGGGRQESGGRGLDPQRTESGSVQPLINSEDADWEIPILSGTNESLWMLEHMTRKLAVEMEARV